jgi:hypothetical protein
MGAARENKTETNDKTSERGETGKAELSRAWVTKDGVRIGNWIY